MTATYKVNQFLPQSYSYPKINQFDTFYHDHILIQKYKNVNERDI